MSEHHVLDHVDEYLKLGREYDCSDLHLATAYPPAWRRYGQLSPIWPEHPPLKPDESERLVRSFLGEKELARLEERGDIDFAYIGSGGRYRASVIKQRLGYDMAFRIINGKLRSMEEIGLPIEHIIPLTRYQNGLILITGSVGSGKSTTLASIVDFINQDRDDHILTLEDPIEYVFESKGCHVNQREVHKHTESFARALRGALREDPDVIMVGEMRDLETTEIAIRAALTGHLVFSTLHTNDAIGGISRLVDMGVEPFLVSSAVRAFFAQRLVRQLCPHCKQPAEVERDYLHSIGFPLGSPGKIMRATGCEACRGSGYQGRLSIYEVVLVTHALQHLINTRAHPAELHKQALKEGFIPMRGYGFQKVLAGETTIEEVLSVTAMERTPEAALRVNTQPLRAAA